MDLRPRRRRLIKPELQTQAIYASLGLISLTAVLFGVVAWFSLRVTLAEHPELLPRVTRALLASGFAVLAVLTPLAFVVVAWGTLRVAGPIHRMEEYLKSHLRGEEPTRLSLRQADELQVLASLLEHTLAKKRARERPVERREASVG